MRDLFIFILLILGVSAVLVLLMLWHLSHNLIPPHFG